jgi:hypothetical protein
MYQMAPKLVRFGLLLTSGIKDGFRSGAAVRRGI